MRFSFVSDEVRILGVTPVRATPTASTLNALVSDVVGGLSRCRETWWAIQGTTCLDNRWVSLSPTGVVVWSVRQPGAAQVRRATYDASDTTLCLLLHDGTEHTMTAGSGTEVL